MDREKVGLRDLLKTRALVIDMSPGRILVDINTGDITNSQTNSIQQAARERIDKRAFWPVSGNEDKEQLRNLAKQLLANALAAALADGRRMTGGDDAGPASAEYQHKRALLEKLEHSQQCLMAMSNRRLHIGPSQMCQLFHPSMIHPSRLNKNDPGSVTRCHFGSCWRPMRRSCLSQTCLFCR